VTENEDTTLIVRDGEGNVIEMDEDTYFIRLYTAFARPYYRRIEQRLQAEAADAPRD
jgi:hypothetical protein